MDKTRNDAFLPWSKHVMVRFDHGQNAFWPWPKRVLAMGDAFWPWPKRVIDFQSAGALYQGSQYCSVDAQLI